MRPETDSGAQLRATFSITGAWPDFELTLESGDGRGRNTDYKLGLDLLLARLAELDAGLVSGRVSSKDIEERVVSEDLKPAFVLDDQPWPVELSPAINAKDLRRSIGRASGRVGSAAGKSGNTTRRITLSLTLPGTPADAEGLQEFLRTGIGEPEPLALVSDEYTLDKALADWRSALHQDAEKSSGKIFWLPTQRMSFSTGAGRRPGTLDTQLRPSLKGSAWTVQINTPRVAGDANATTAVARTPSGKLFLIRQGRLTANPDSDGDILEDRFRVLSGLVPLHVSGGATPKAREWYLVADLNRSPDMIVAQTAKFVDDCARVRRLSLGGESAAADAVLPMFAPGETGGTFLKNAVEAQPSKLVLRRQGEVWLALERELEAAGLKLLKLRHQGGYETDGVIEISPQPVLLEIKTAASAADLYEGVGQLLIYADLLKLQAYRKILLLPGNVHPALVLAAQAQKIELHTYKATETDGEISVEFSKDFQGVWGS